MTAPLEDPLDRYVVPVVGIGNSFRRDDGVGPAVIEALRADPPPGVRLEATDDPAQLLAWWDGCELAIVVDAARSSAATAGHVLRITGDELSHTGGPASTHALGIAEVVDIARELERLPARLVVFAVEVADTDFGDGLGAAVAAAVPVVAAAVRAELAEEH